MGGKVAEGTTGGEVAGKVRREGIGNRTRAAGRVTTGGEAAEGELW